MWVCLFVEGKREKPQETPPETKVWVRKQVLDADTVAKIRWDDSNLQYKV